MTPKEEAKKFLQNNYLASVATLSPDGEPQVAIVLYCLDDEFNFYFATRKHTRKSVNLENNGKIGIAVGGDHSPATAQMQGRAETSQEHLSEFTKRLEERSDIKNYYCDSFLKIPGLDLQVFRVKMSWLRYMRLNPETGREEYLQIDV